jgi:hypothetical protein
MTTARKLGHNAFAPLCTSAEPSLLCAADLAS